ncbi:unnamed protein product [Cuscuta campestris]|uniref:Uncharacterized protein n=1 Tax=Cuscuta campestris TaxID=132261 RepID=A0A484M8V6_9ASTE|nr:unnamed protein product [Cuscuta campestris]
MERARVETLWMGWRMGPRVDRWTSGDVSPSQARWRPIIQAINPTKTQARLASASPPAIPSSLELLHLLPTLRRAHATTSGIAASGTKIMRFYVLTLVRRVRHVFPLFLLRRTEPSASVDLHPGRKSRYGLRSSILLRRPEPSASIDLHPRKTSGTSGYGLRSTSLPEEERRVRVFDLHPGRTSGYGLRSASLPEEERRARVSDLRPGRTSGYGLRSAFLPRRSAKRECLTFIREEHPISALQSVSGCPSPDQLGLFFIIREGGRRLYRPSNLFDKRQIIATVEAWMLGSDNSSTFAIRLICSGVSELSFDRSASYSTSLFDALKPNRIEYYALKPSGAMTTTPPPEFLAAEEPSVKTIHQSLASGSSGLGSSQAVHSTMKSASAWPLITGLGLNSIWKAPRNTAHLDMREGAFGLLSSAPMGCWEST